MKVYSYSNFGYEGSLVEVEVDLRRGIPATDIVGISDGAVKETKERLFSAVRNSGLEYPKERTLISLSPCDMKKEGAGLDLAIAFAVEAAQYKMDMGEVVLVLGELELSGKVGAVRGMIGALATAEACGIKHAILPESLKGEVTRDYGMKVFWAKDLLSTLEALKDPTLFKPLVADTDCSSFTEYHGIRFPKIEESTDTLEANEKAMEAVKIAVAGRLNLLAYGPNGNGKTLALQGAAYLQPLLTNDEAMTTTRINSLAGLSSLDYARNMRRPFRMPHQTATIEGICGGGIMCRPGEISLAHNGILFLDEASEFRSSVLQMLRVPLESRHITLSRAGRVTSYPADFQLFMSANPCPCGNYGSSRLCLCSARSIEMYWKKFSYPLLDRIHIIANTIDAERKIYRIGELREEIARAIRIQMDRQNKPNGRLSPAEITEYCKLTDEADKTFKEYAEKNSLTPRKEQSLILVARTIADLRGGKEIGAVDIRNATDGLALVPWLINESIA